MEETPLTPYHIIFIKDKMIAIYKSSENAYKELRAITDVDKGIIITQLALHLPKELFKD